jgi:dihydrofolate reductase
MSLSIIVAMSRDFVIGDEQGLPWRLPTDLKRFRKYTLGKPVIMGRKTRDLIGRPLPGRTNIVLTRDQNYQADEAVIVYSWLEAIESAHRVLAPGQDEVMVIGGAKIYRLALPDAERLYLTVVEGEFTGTVYFPREVPDKLLWRKVSEEVIPADERNPHAHVFAVFEKNSHGAAANPLTLATFLNRAS